MADLGDDLREELGGPEVLASRGKTTDSGGGRLVLSAGKLLVRGSVRGRVLGEIARLRAIAFTDAGARRVELSFDDGTVWELIDKKRGRLLPFFRSIEHILGRSDLVSVAPGPLDRLGQYLTGERRRRIAEAGIGVLAAWLLSLAVARAAPLGDIVIALAAVWLLGLLLEKRWAAARPFLPPMGRVARRYGAVLTVAVPVMLMAGSAAGLHQAARRSALEARAERNRLRAERERALAAKRDAERKRLEELRAKRLAERMQEAMNESRWRDAHRIYLEIKAFKPEHGSLKAAWNRLGPELAALREKERLEAVASGIRQARRTARDRVMCESARTVADTWNKLRQVRPDDDQWFEALKAIEGLERCRRRLEAVFNQNAIGLRRQARREFSRAARYELQKSGYAPRTELKGKNERIMTVTIAGLIADRAAAISGGGTPEQSTLLQRAQKAGFEAVVLGNGKGKTWRYDLEPRDESRIGVTVLKKFGLDMPLRLEATAGASADAPK